MHQLVFSNDKKHNFTGRGKNAMYDFMLTPEERDLRKKVRQFVLEEVTADFLRKMDKDEITYPREFVLKLF